LFKYEDLELGLNVVILMKRKNDSRPDSSKTLALYKSRTYLLTYLLAYLESQNMATEIA